MIDIVDKVNSIYNSLGNTLIVIGRDFTIASKKGRIVGYSHRYKDIYRIVYPVTGNPEIDDRIKMHEYGHIYCGHFEGIWENLDASLIRVINNKDKQLIKLINENCDIDYAEDILDKVIKDPWLNHRIHNVAMDMEVNSSILDENDINIVQSEMNNYIYEEYMRISENGTKMPSNKELVNLHAKFNMKGVVPSDLGFQPGLTYPDYLVLIILNLDKFLRLLCNYYNNEEEIMKAIKSGGMNGQGRGQSSGTAGSGSGGEDQEDQNKNIPKTKEEFEEMMKNARSGPGGDSPDDDDDNDSEGRSFSKPSDKDGDKDGSGKGGSEGSDKDEDKSDGSENSNGENSDGDDEDHGSDSRNEADENRKKDLGEYSYHGGKGRGLSKSSCIRDYVINNDPLKLTLEEIIREFRHKVIKRDFTKDLTHKYNRRILGRGNNMISPTYRLKITKTENPTILFGVDVSGSMDTNLVDKIITSIRREMKNIDRSLTYSIAAWDTELCEYYKNIDFNTPIPKLSCGGGTKLAGLFDLLKKDFGKDAILIIISDFGDDLNEWHQKEKDMTGYSMYGLKYGGNEWYGGESSMPNFKNFKVREIE